MNIRNPRTRVHTSRRRFVRGFSLLEIMIVLTIMTLLAGAGVWTYNSLIGDAQDQRVSDDIRNFRINIDAYARGNNFRPPTQDQGLMALVEKPTTEPVPRSWRQRIEELPLDPYGNEYQYRYPASRSSRDKYDIFSMGEDGVESEDDIGNW